MPQQKKDATTKSVKIEIDRLTLRNSRLEAKLQVATDELNFAKQALKEIEAGYKARVLNTLKLDIQDVLECSDTELAKLTQDKSVEELESMLSNFILAKGDIEGQKKTRSTFKPIKPAYGASTVQNTGLTVGCLFGKTREDILKMKGDF